MLEPQIVTKTIKTVVAGQVVSLGEVEIEDPSLVLSTYEVVLVVGVVEPTTVELSYLGEGTITVTNPNPTALSATYDSVTRTIALVNNQSKEDSDVDVNLTVSLSRLGNCVTESVTLTAHCLLAGLDPELEIWATNADAGCWGGVSFLGNGTVTLSSTTAGSFKYNANNKTFTCYVDPGVNTITVSLTADPPYAAASASTTWNAGKFASM